MEKPVPSRSTVPWRGGGHRFVCVEVECCSNLVIAGQFRTVQESGVTAQKPWVAAMVRRPRVARDSVTSHRVLSSKIAASVPFFGEE